jgi:hypothetical protein
MPILTVLSVPEHCVMSFYRMRLCVVYCENIMQTAGMCAYRGNVVCLPWECYVYRGNYYRVIVMHTVGMLCLQWECMRTARLLCVSCECYAHYVNVMHILGMLCILWEFYAYGKDVIYTVGCYVYRGNVMPTVGMLCVPRTIVMCIVGMLCALCACYA